MPIFRIALAVAALLLVATSALAASLALDKDRLVILLNDKKIVLPDDMGKLEDVSNSDMRYVSFDADNDMVKKFGITPGLYIVNENRVIIHFTGTLPPKTGDFSDGLKPEEFGSGVSGASLSPKGDYLALSIGYTFSGHLIFFTWPDMGYVKVGAIPFYSLSAVESAPTLYWYDTNKAAFEEINLETKREGQYDPCGNVSVKAVDLATGKVSTVKQGTDLCDYRLLATRGGQGHIAKVCLKSVGAWKTYPDMRKAVKEWVPLP